MLGIHSAWQFLYTTTTTNPPLPAVSKNSFLPILISTLSIIRFLISASIIIGSPWRVGWKQTSINISFFGLGPTCIMGEFPYACPRGYCTSLLSSLENISVKGRKRDYGGIPQKNDREPLGQDNSICHDSLWYSKEAIPTHFHQILYSVSPSWYLPPILPTARRMQHHARKTTISSPPSINLSIHACFHPHSFYPISEQMVTFFLAKANSSIPQPWAHPLKILAL